MGTGLSLTALACGVIEPVERTGECAGFPALWDAVDRQARLIRILNQELDAMEPVVRSSPVKALAEEDDILPGFLHQ